MRLFVGVAVTDEVRASAARVSAEIRDRLGARVAARWVPAENLHLTVRFIGHVADDRVGDVLHALKAPLGYDAFELEFSGAGRFPPRGAPRVLWIGVTRGLPQLTALHDEFNRRLSPVGYPPEARAFSAHLTLARLKDAPSSAGRELDTTLGRVDTGIVTQHVDRVTVYESRPGANGGRYAIVRELPLTRGT